MGAYDCSLEFVRRRGEELRKLRTEALQLSECADKEEDPAEVAKARVLAQQKFTQHWAQLTGLWRDVLINISDLDGEGTDGEILEAVQAIARAAAMAEWDQRFYEAFQERKAGA